MIETGVGKNGQSTHSGEDDKDPKEHAVHHHGHELPVLFQLSTVRDLEKAEKMETREH